MNKNLRGYWRKVGVSVGLLLLGGAAFMSCSSRSAEERVANKLGISRDEVRHMRNTHGVSTLFLTQMGRDRVRDLTIEGQHPDLARYREAFWAMLHRDQEGRIPAGAFLEALRQAAVLRAKVPKARFRVAGVPVRAVSNAEPTAGLHEDHSGWAELGPWSVGGRTRAIAVDSKNRQRMWLGSVGGGVWLTTDGAQHFAPVDDLMSNLVVSTLAIDPTDSNKVYAGTGEGFFNLDALRGGGIFRTIDGKSWSRLESTQGEDFSFVNRLSFSPDGTGLLAATRSGIFLSTRDDRSDWSQRLSANVADVKYHPTDGSHAIAGGLDTGTAYFSDDGGRSWTAAAHTGNWVHVWEDGSTSPSRVEVTYSIANPGIVYASVDNNNGEVWRSADGGHSYSKMDSVIVGPDGLSAEYLGAQGWYGNVIWAGDPSNPDFLLLGGVNLWKSTDGGKTLVDISAWDQSNSAHADNHVIVSDPGFNGNTNKTVFFGNDGGLFVTQDVSSVGSDVNRSLGWTALNHHYGVTQFYGVAIGSDGTVVGGAQDNGTLLLNAGGTPESWSEMFGGDGGSCAADPSDPNYLYGEYVQANIHRRSKIGQPADFISGQWWDAQNQRVVWKNPPYLIPDARSGRANFIAPFVLDPNNSSRILVGGASLWVTNDAKTQNTNDTGPSWLPVKDPASELISAIAVAKRDSNIVWVGHNNGDLYRTSNGLSSTPKWESVNSATSVLPKRMVTRITIDAADARIVYVAFGGYSSGNIWKTNDGGAHWTNVATMLPKAPVFSLAIHPKNHKYVYAGTEVGIFASEDGGAHWSPGNQGPNNSAVFELVWSGNTLFAATHGRGMFKIDLSSVPPGS